MFNELGAKRREKVREKKRIRESKGYEGEEERREVGGGGVANFSTHHSIFSSRQLQKKNPNTELHQ